MRKIHATATLNKSITNVVRFRRPQRSIGRTDSRFRTVGAAVGMLVKDCAETFLVVRCKIMHRTVLDILRPVTWIRARGARARYQMHAAQLARSASVDPSVPIPSAHI